MHNEPIETIKTLSHFEQGKFIEGKTLKIYTDDDPLNPRTDYDNFGRMVCFHKRYSLGDLHGIDHTEFSSWDEMKDHLVMEKEAKVILPIYMYDHSGLTIRTHPFSDNWDSGQIGFIYASRGDILKNWGGKHLTKELLKKADDLLQAEVEEYDDYLTGNVYGYTLEDEHGEELWSCWGYFGDDAIAQIKSEVHIDIRPQLLDSEKGEA